jgi:8-oxo-dGTP pyrophosphatase MutT (NUDIX family)
MIHPWTRVGTRTLNENPVFTLRTHAARNPVSGTCRDFYVLEAGDWVNVVPLTPDGRMILVRQYRHGTDEVTLEIPGGMVEPGQTPEEAARRELAEETGCEPHGLVFLGRVRPNPAIQNNWRHTFLALGTVPAGPPRPDEDELLDVVVVPQDEIPRLVAEGAIHHTVVLAAFYF